MTPPDMFSGMMQGSGPTQAQAGMNMGITAGANTGLPPAPPTQPPPVTSDVASSTNPIDNLTRILQSIQEGVSLLGSSFPQGDTKHLQDVVTSLIQFSIDVQNKLSPHSTPNMGGGGMTPPLPF